MKYILVIGDGMADNAVASLGNKTPLEFVQKPAIDGLASKGMVGNVKNCPDGLPAGSDTAILSIFGADPNVCYTGRSPLEAAATGIVLKAGDVSYRCNMVALEDGELPFEERKILSHSAGSIEGEESIDIINALFADEDFAKCAKEAGMIVYPSPSFRHIAVQSGFDINGITLAPPHDHLGEVIGGFLPEGCDNAVVLKNLMKKAHEFLDKHPLNEKRRNEGKLPANGIWFWAEGTYVALENFYDKYKKKGTVISAVPLCHGIAKLSGLDVTMVEGATGELETNLEGKVEACITALKNGYDFAAIHVEAPDECTHNGDLEGKLTAIGYLDTRVIAPIAKTMEEEKMDYRLLFISDHKTLTATRGHDGEPVPYLIYDSRIDTKRNLPYTEKSGEKGDTIPAGTALMPLLFEI